MEWLLASNSHYHAKLCTCRLTNYLSSCQINLRRLSGQLWKRWRWSINEIQPWLFAIAPLEGESLSHFLGRFRGENDLSASGLGTEAGIGGVVARWEKFDLNPFPSRRELEALAKVVQVDADRLREMLPAEGVGMKHEPIRLCGACYAELPFTRLNGSLRRPIGAIATS